MKGTITGSFNEMTMQNGIPLTDEIQLQLAERYGGIGAWGGQMMDPHYSAAWATIPVGGAGLIVAYPHSAAAKVEPAVTRAIKRTAEDGRKR